jgi:hypothetical protein
MFYRSKNTFFLATGEGDHPNVNEYVSFKISFALHRICEFHILALKGMR